MPTIFDVAQQAGVSIASVSLVLNNPQTKRVGAEKREGILRIAREVGYIPNLIAKGLRSNSTGILGLIVPMRDPIFFNLFISEVLAGIQSCLLQRGYHLMIYSHDGTGGRITNHQIVQSKLTDGVIFINTRMCTASDIELSIKELRTAQTPFVIINSYYGKANINYVGVDDYEIGRMAGTYLSERGHQKIALIAGSRKSPGSAPLLRGFKKALAEHDISLPARYVAYGEYNKEIIQDSMHEWLQAEDRPTAVFCASDQMMLNVYQVLQAEKIEIPQQVAVMGRGDLMFVSFLNPPLTIIRVPMFDLGYKAADLLIKSLDNAQMQHSKILLPCELIKRASA